MKKGFTLAEVLITLGIIGVVAAMTLPTLINKYRTQEKTSKLKKFYSVMNQALLMSENDNGEFRHWNFDTTGYRDEEGKKDHAKVSDLCENFFNTYLKKYISYYKYEKGLNTSYEDGTTNFKTNRIIFNDGSIVYLNAGDCFDLIYDLNGDKNPNMNAEDRFFFYICPYGSQNKTNPNEKLATSTHVANTHSTREGAYNLCKSDRNQCTRLLQIDNWEFKNDYPW